MPEQELKKDNPAGLGNSQLSVSDGQAGLPTFAEIGLGQFAPYLMNRIANRWNADNQETLRKLGLTTTQMRILAVLTTGDMHSIGELSTLAVTEQSTLSRALDNMEKADLIERRQRKGDNRFVDIRLTTFGWTRFDEIWPSMYAGYQDMLTGISEDEHAAFLKTLHKLLNNIRKTDF